MLCSLGFTGLGAINVCRVILTAQDRAGLACAMETADRLAVGPEVQAAVLPRLAAGSAADCVG